MKFIIGTALLGIVFLRCESESIPEPTKVQGAARTKEHNAPSENDSVTVKFITHAPLGVNVDLPEHMRLVNENQQRSIDFCDYEIKLEDGFVVGEIHSLTNGRFLLDTVTDFYQEAQNNPSISISYKVQTDNWFVISGTNKKTGAIIYWKRIVGEPYVSDLEFEYPPERRGEIEPYLGRISRSFQDH